MFVIPIRRRTERDLASDSVRRDESRVERTREFLRHAPPTQDDKCWIPHRNFKVARPRSAKMIERIQNLTITVFSFQPLNSKW